MMALRRHWAPKGPLSEVLSVTKNRRFSTRVANERVNGTKIFNDLRTFFLLSVIKPRIPGRIRLRNSLLAWFEKCVDRVAENQPLAPKDAGRE
jgi:cellulose biosynthesis protein BcsQ